MIGFLKGTLLQKRPPFLLLDVQGVGYELESPMSTVYDLPEEGQDVSLYAHLVVREDAQLLFGFSDQEQRELFRSLLKVNGVGPRVALAILSTLSTAEFLDCIRLEDAATLTRVPGIGKKTAERMLLDMRDRVEGMTPAGATGAAVAAPHADNPVSDAISALVALGFRPAEASRAVDAVREQSDARDELIRNALQQLAKK